MLLRGICNFSVETGEELSFHLQEAKMFSAGNKSSWSKVSRICLLFGLMTSFNLGLF